MMARVTTYSIVLAICGLFTQQAICQQFGGGPPQAFPPYGGQPPQDFSYYGPESGPPAGGYTYNASLMQEGFDPTVQDGDPNLQFVQDDFSGDVGFQVFPETQQANTSTWFTMETLLWKRHERKLPPLITTSPPPTPRNGGPTPPIAGVVGMPTTSVIFGGKRVGEDLEVGSNIEWGMWLDTLNEIGVGGRFWILDDEEVAVHADSSMFPILGVPFFNTDIGFEDALLVGYPNAAFPPVTVGSVDINMSNEMHGAEAYMRLNLLYFNAQPIMPGFAGQPQRAPTRLSFDMLTGYQYNRINDLITIQGQFDSAPFMAVPALTANFVDSFRTKNKFHGGSLGMTVEATRGRWSLKGLGKVGFGNMRQTATVNGFTNFTVGGVTTMKPGGVFTQTTNIGNFKRNHFAYVPEAKVNLSYQLTDNIRLTSGVNFVYWSSVLLAANQIDRMVDRDLLIGPDPAATSPAFTFNDTDFWALGLNTGFFAEY